MVAVHINVVVDPDMGNMMNDDNDDDTWMIDCLCFRVICRWCVLGV
jgi:hypothetical protein